MSKLKTNDKVIIKATGKSGIIKGRDVVNLRDDKVKIEYIVKTDEGFENWGTFSKDELEKVRPIHEAKNHPSLIADAPNGYKVTLVAIVTNARILKENYNEYGIYDPYLRKGKDLKIGYAICNPNDEFDFSLGARIATNRAKKMPFCHLTSDFNGEFNTETVYALLQAKADYITRNINKFIR